MFKKYVLGMSLIGVLYAEQQDESKFDENGYAHVIDIDQDFFDRIKEENEAVEIEELVWHSDICQSFDNPDALMRYKKQYSELFLFNVLHRCKEIQEAIEKKSLS